MRVQQFSVNETETDLKDTQVASILAINQMAQSRTNGASYPPKGARHTKKQRLKSNAINAVHGAAWCSPDQSRVF